MDGLKRLVRAKAVIVPVVLVALAGVTVASRAVTTAVLGDDSRPGATETTVPGQTTSETRSDASTSTTTTPDSPVSSAVSPDDTGEEPPGETGGAVVEDQTIVAVGDVIIETPEPVSFPNRVTVLPGGATDRATSQGETTPDDSDLGSGADSPFVAGEASDEVFEEGISDRFTIQMSAEPNGHFASIVLSMNNVPEGLDLRVDFGDGDTFEVPANDLERLRGSGSVDVEHRYEPTLTPQPQSVRAVAMDEGQVVGTANVAFETQAEFLVSFSALQLTALDGCDLFGKGDFELEWNNDGRERRTKFKLDEGESYIEEGFRVGHDGIRYDDEPIEVTLGVYERDPLWVHLFRFPIAYELDRAPEVLPLGVRELATHTYPLEVEFHAGRQCDARFDFTVTYAFADPPR